SSGTNRRLYSRFIQMNRSVCKGRNLYWISLEVQTLFVLFSLPRSLLTSLVLLLLYSCYTLAMTLLEAKFELQSPLTHDQLRALSDSANPYGLLRLQLDDTQLHLSFEYDGSRLRETQVTHVLGHAGIAVTRRLN